MLSAPSLFLSYLSNHSVIVSSSMPRLAQYSASSLWSMSPSCARSLCHRGCTHASTPSASNSFITPSSSSSCSSVSIFLSRNTSGGSGSYMVMNLSMSLGVQ
eukprot:TRINITY_DN676_c0_g1_i4.p1 TRINITY_DN676_c0_g1~~TRINITY_DN676_c0_g1_i4.p1  ORF type:complete len:102 (-),score=7.57 TRINITY_DN676_c0_g1_i4:314-619(-)